jgi:hypothetical protein
MSQQDIAGFYQYLRARLGAKDYTELKPVQPIDIAFFKLGWGGSPYAIAVVDTRHVTNTPTEILRRVESWLLKTVGRSGGAVLLFVYPSPPPVTTVEEIQKISGQVIAGAHDLHTGRHWLINHLGWEDELYGK